MRSARSIVIFGIQTLLRVPGLTRDRSRLRGRFTGRCAPEQLTHAADRAHHASSFCWKKDCGAFPLRQLWKRVQVLETQQIHGSLAWWKGCRDQPDGLCLRARHGEPCFGEALGTKYRRALLALGLLYLRFPLAL